MNPHDAIGPCPTCGRPLLRGIGRTPPTRHPACRKFSYYLAAAVRALRDIDFAPGCAVTARRALVGASNGLETRWQRPRLANGRFAPSYDLAAESRGVSSPSYPGAEADIDPYAGMVNADPHDRTGDSADDDPPATFTASRFARALWP